MPVIESHDKSKCNQEGTHQILNFYNEAYTHVRNLNEAVLYMQHWPPIFYSSEFYSLPIFNVFPHQKFVPYVW